MGIKGLWTVLAPYSEKKSLHEIRGETVAIDLSGWICDSQNVTDYHIQPKLYLRNLFFRTIYLLLGEVNPIFVLEGDAPESKQDVMANRNALQFRGTALRSEASRNNNKKPDVARKRFKNVHKECESLLKSMGVACVKGKGEAEATCADLNRQGLVDAVVSQDSDCFAYGAKRVYRNFSVSSAAGGGALQGSIDCYDADKMFKHNGFGRNKMVALALLCGCDYGVGVCGSSINTVVSFLHTVAEKDVISRLVSWVDNREYYEEQSRWVAVSGRCDRCGHAGRAHSRNGCPVCTMPLGCQDTGHKLKLAEVKRELSLRSRALSSELPFPATNIMDEFLHRTAENIDLNITTNTTSPKLIQFIKLMSSKLDWSERYCVEKFLPLLTRWHLQTYVPIRTIEPVKINKKRHPRGVPSYEVVWNDIDGQYEGLIPDDQFEDGEDHLKPWTSSERQDLMREFYPELVENYEESIKKPAKPKKSRGRKKNCTEPEKPKRKYKRKIKDLVDIGIHNLSSSIKNLDLSANKTEHNISNKVNVSVNVRRLKRKLKNKNQKTLDSFIAKKKRKSSLLRSCFGKYKNDSNNTTHKSRESSNLLGMLEVSANSINDSELSDIVDGIVSEAPITKTTHLDNNVMKLIFEKHSTPRKSFCRRNALNEFHDNCSTPNDSPIQKRSDFSSNVSNHSFHSKVNTSYFFDKFTNNCDAFEMSVEYKHKSGITHLDCDATIDYSLPDVGL